MISTILNIAFSLISASFLIFIYIFPSYIAYRANKKNGASIVALNILLGWTFIGWVIALVWSMMVD